MHYYVGIAALSDEPSSYLVDNVKDFIDNIAPHKDKIRFVLGGYWGLMKYIADYASSKGFKVIFILPEYPRENPPRKDNFIIVRTELGYRTRSIILAMTSDILVCAGGRVGSIIEVMISYSFSKPIIVLRNTGLDTDKLEEGFKEYIDSRRLARIYYVDKGADIAGKVIELLNL